MGRSKNDVGLYNEVRKRQFLYDYVGEKDSQGNLIKDDSGNYKIKSMANYQRAHAVLKRMAPYEIKYNKDICEIQRGEDDAFLQSVYTELFPSISDKTSRSYHSVLKKYIRWCYDENIITSTQYYDNPFYSSWIKPGKTKSVVEYRSTRIKNQIKMLKEDVDSDDPKIKDYIFKSENDFFEYVRGVFGNDKRIMDATIYCLLYYGFDTKEIRLIERTEVDEGQHTVRGIKIENDIAFDLICKAKHADSYLNVSSDGYGYVRFYCDSVYLIRSYKTTYQDQPITMSYINKILKRAKEASLSDGVDPKYRGAAITKISLIVRLKPFYQAVSDQEQYGERYVVVNFRNDQYKPLRYREYQTMLIKMGQ